jgi:hypothetical protein
MFGSIMIGCKGYETLRCKGANIELGIMDDDKLVKHFEENGVGVNVSLAQTKRDVEGWLRSRGFDIEQIERFLTYSVLSE